MAIPTTIPINGQEEQGIMFAVPKRRVVCFCPALVSAVTLVGFRRAWRMSHQFPSMCGNAKPTSVSCIWADKSALCA